MSRFGDNTDYNPTGGSSDGGDYKERDSLLLSNYAIVSAELVSVGVYEGNYGLNLILNCDDGVVHEGVLTRRTDNGDGEADDKLKVFGWDQWYDRDEDYDLVPFDEGGEITTDNLGRRVTQEAGGDTYRYDIEEGVLEGRDEPVEIGDFEHWLSNGKKARTFAKVLSERGHDVVDQDNKRDDRDWLAVEDEDDFQLRDELQGRRIMFWFERTTLTPDDMEGLDDTVTFTDSVILDGETEAPITIVNSDEEDESSTESDSSDAETDGSSDGGDDVEGGEQELPQDVDELVDMFARTGQDDPDSIETIVTEESPADYEVDIDAIMSEVQARS